MHICFLEQSMRNLNLHGEERKTVHFVSLQHKQDRHFFTASTHLLSLAYITSGRSLNVHTNTLHCLLRYMKPLPAERKIMKQYVSLHVFGCYPDVTELASVNFWYTIFSSFVYFSMSPASSLRELLSYVCLPLTLTSSLSPSLLTYSSSLCLLASSQSLHHFLACACM